MTGWWSTSSSQTASERPKYVKLKLLSVHGGCPPVLTQIRVLGKPGT